MNVLCICMQIIWQSATQQRHMVEPTVSTHGIATYKHQQPQVIGGVRTEKQHWHDGGDSLFNDTYTIPPLYTHHFLHDHVVDPQQIA